MKQTKLVYTVKELLGEEYAKKDTTNSKLIIEIVEMKEEKNNYSILSDWIYDGVNPKDKVYRCKHWLETEKEINKWKDIIINDWKNDLAIMLWKK